MLSMLPSVMIMMVMMMMILMRDVFILLDFMAK